MITLKGSSKGISLSIDDADFETGREELIEKLTQNKDFFKGAELSVYMTSNTLTEAEVFLLRETVERVLENASIRFIDSEPRMIPMQHSPLEDLAQDEGITKFCRKTIKQGETVEYGENLVVIGDVEAGAKVIAGGNVFVLGALYGSVHAGAGGRKDAVVVAMKLMPEKLIISDLSVKVKQSAIKRIFSGVPEIAYVSRNTIKIEQYT